MKKQFSNLMRHGFLLGALLMFMGFQQVNAQQTINGAVVDESGVGVPGANVIVKGTSNGAVTDFDGNFSISASSSDVLEISFLGFVTQSVTVGNQTLINVTLAVDAAQLDEVVVIGYGTAKRSDLTESVTQVTAKSFEEQPVTRVEEALQGRTAGVSVARANGAPGAGAKIRIRGVNSISGNNSPLVVIDGFIGGDLRTLNPSDIQTFDVLKDASATAIYGSRGANGVILVTTKKGKGKAKIDFNTFVSVSELARTYDNRVDALQYYRDVNNPARFGNTSEQDLIDNPVADRESELFRTAFAKNYQMSVSGGSEDFNYFVSGNYVNQEGIMVTNQYEKYSLRANLEAKINDKLKIGVRTFYNREIDQNNPNTLSRIFGGPVIRTLAYDPTFRMRNADGSFNYQTVTTGGSGPSYYVTNLYRSSFERIANRFNFNLNIDYQFTPSLNYTLIAGATTLNQKSGNIQIETPENGADLQGNQGSVNTNDFNNYQISNILNWNKTFGKHNFNVTGVYEFTKSEASSQGFRRTLLPFNITNVELLQSDITDKETLFINSSSGRSAIVSFLGRLKYTFNDRLSLSASIRSDETTAFLKSERVGVFGSFSAGYNFTTMDFIQNSDVFSNLRLRLSWGETGNQNAPRAAFEDSFTTTAVLNPVTGNIVNIQNQTTVGNPNLTWETTEQTNIGLDLGLFSGRVNLTVDAYEKKTRDLIVTTLNNLNIPGTNITENVGDVENKGIDVSLNTDIIRNDNLRWNSTIAFSYIKNEVVRISPKFEEGTGRPNQLVGNFPDAGGREFINVISVGNPLGSFYGTVFEGVNDQGIAINSSKQVIGSGLPTTTWGFNNSINYKNWDFNVFFQGSNGFDVFNQVEAVLAGGNPSFTGYLKSDQEQVSNVGLNSSRYVEKGDFIRLSNLSVGYTFDNPTKGVNSVKLTASGQNLFLITDYSGYDPEVSSAQSTVGETNSDVSSGIDSGAIPNPRVFTFGVKIGL